MARKYSISSSRSNSVISSSSTWNLFERNFENKVKTRSTGKTYVQTIGPCISGDLNAVDSQGRSLIFYAVRYGQVDTVLQLIQAGCNVSQTDTRGNTPLHGAIAQGNLDMASVLLKEGSADVDISGTDGETPLTMAVSRGQMDAVRLLHKYGN